MDKKPTHRNTSCGNLRRPHRTKTSTVWCCLLLRVAAFWRAHTPGDRVCPLWWKGYRPRVRPTWEPKGTKRPDLEPAFKAAQNILPNLEARIIEFLSEWLVTFLMPAKHVLDTRAPHLYFMFSKEYWFRELYLGLKVTREAPTPSPKIISVSGAKNEPQN